MRLFFRVSLTSGLFAACATPASHDGASGSSGVGGDSAVASDATQPCNALGSPSCAKGQTCCFSGVTGTCKDLAACTSSVQFECQGPDTCNVGEVCCATIPPAPGLDASAFSQDGGAEGGQAQLLMGVTATSFCASTCSSPSASVCRTGADCVGGGICSPLPEGNLVLVALGAETLVVCATADGGAPPSESGASESGHDGAASDAPSGD